MEDARTIYEMRLADAKESHRTVLGCIRLASANHSLGADAPSINHQIDELVHNLSWLHCQVADLAGLLREGATPHWLPDTHQWFLAELRDQWTLIGRLITSEDSRLDQQAERMRAFFNRHAPVLPDGRNTR